MKKVAMNKKMGCVLQITTIFHARLSDRRNHPSWLNCLLLQGSCAEDATQKT